MAGNDWVNSYLEAILDVGQPLDDARPSLLLRGEAGSLLAVTSLRKSLLGTMRLIFTSHGPRLLLRGVRKRGTHGWRTCVGGSGISLVKRSSMRKRKHRG
ncbi:unnamed protein product [Brassica napus]|nr:unnamed protein product [Brassica napus]